jgi:transcriptional regulator
MYCPPHVRADPAEALSQPARAPRLDVLVCNGEGAPLLSPMPLMLRDGAPIGHLPRATPEASALRAAGRAIALLPGAHACVSPSLFPSQALYQRVVPAWNHEGVTVEGAAVVIHDATALHAIAPAPTEAAEPARDAASAVTDAPPSFLAARITGKGGVTLSAETVIAKRKAAQNTHTADRAGLRAGRVAGDPAARAIGGLTRCS